MSVHKISVYPVHGEWRCDIEAGPGHHGIGETPAAATLNAALAWERWEAANETTCPDCGRHVSADRSALAGFVAACGRRVTRLNECRAEPCVNSARAALEDQS